jgi:hypothetical protein
MLKFTLKFTIKVLLHVSVYNHHLGAFYTCFAKVMIIKITNQFGHVAAATRPNWFHNDVF